MTRKWDNHFLHLALDHARMSKDPSTHVGATIVGPDREIRSAGFNGFPRGIVDDAERLYNRELKLRLMVHAELNAILAAARIGVSVRGCTLYLSAIDLDGSVWGGCPCSRCSTHIIQAGITEVVSWVDECVPERWREDITLSKGLLEEAGVLYREVER